MATVNLYSVPECDMAYEHAPYFESRSAQSQWMLGRRKLQIMDVNISVDPNRTSVTLPHSYEEIESWNVDYASLSDPSGKTLYYFVADYDYTTTSATTLILVLDPLQTFMFDIDFKDSFVERCHVDRWTDDNMPTKEFEAEGLEFGEHIQKEKIKIKQVTENNYLIVASNPLGIINRKNRKDGDYPDGTGGDPGDCGDWKEGIISVEGYRFIKGWEGFATLPYKDHVGFWTIGYGITEKYQKKLYDQLYKGGKGCTEEEAAKVMYDIVNSDYGKPIVEACKKLGVTKQYQFDALCSLSFNAGPSSVTGKNPITDAIKADINNEAVIRAAWETYKLAGGAERRRQECDIFFNKLPKPRPIVTIKPDGKYGPPVSENGGDGWLPTCGSDPGGDTFEAAGHKWQYPVRGKKCLVTAKFGNYPTRPGKHYGIDMAPKDGAAGLPIYATRDGVVEVAGPWGDAGNMVRILHDDLNPQLKTLYMHNKTVNVKVGDRVKAGDVIATMGTTGNSTGVHCHYQLEKPPYGNANAINPIPHLEVGDEV